MARSSGTPEERAAAQTRRRFARRQWSRRWLAWKYVVGALVLVAQVDHVEVVTVDQISLELKNGKTVRWGSAAQSEEKAQVLVALLRQDAQVYDVSVPGTPTTSN